MWMQCHLFCLASCPARDRPSCDISMVKERPCQGSQVGCQGRPGGDEMDCISPLGIVTEYMPGGSLHEALRCAPAFGPRQDQSHQSSGFSAWQEPSDCCTVLSRQMQAMTGEACAQEAHVIMPIAQALLFLFISCMFALSHTYSSFQHMQLSSFTPYWIACTNGSSCLVQPLERCHVHQSLAPKLFAGCCAR